mmetsp:Transcript_26841/g.56896  ORF Transcript_26841/g.56896 Transcript_26841/m.56896 type:complete len:304 (+) Transcript_26841:83-994(+)
MARLGFFGLCIVGLLCSGGALKVRDDWRGEGQAAQIDPSFEGLLPIEWVHVPKTGTSFLNTLYHIPGVCPGLPSGALLSEQSGMGGTLFKATYDLESMCNSSNIDLHRDTHYGIEGETHKPSMYQAHLGVDIREGGPGWSVGKGRFMMMMRQPERRFLSARHFAEETGYGQEHAGTGCVTKMLTRSTYGCGGSPVTRAEIDEAKIRVQTGFSFIGMTDEWNLSLCLFNTMFNQKCQDFQFSNMRPTSNSSESETESDAKLLKDFRDPDSELFPIGVAIFESNLKKYNVSEASCRACWREAGVL